MRANQSGVCPARQVSTQPSAWMAAMDGLGLPLILFDANGRELQRTTAFSTILMQEPALWRRQVLDAIKQMTGEQLDHVRPYPGKPVVRREPYREAATKIGLSGARRYTLRAIRIDEPNHHGAELGRFMVLIALERRNPLLPSAEHLRTRFALTRREAEVALLLAQRMQNVEIAETLCVSVHTARHHTERVLDKLCVRRRLDVTRILQNMHTKVAGLILIGLIEARALVPYILDMGFGV